ncbi:XRE family transcriptional regulator [Deinococcus cavernae]|uniref:XRE family transcriptional regulator n=2 Tax=Deinococcus cavernae TaxID=2320857 RepID=A0A418VE88_9DEIO|nr:XRE family transcriptional regulator [Deinococcus cavernae]
MIERRQINPEKVKHARERAGIGAYEAASAARISAPAYYRWEDVVKGPLRKFDFFALQDLARKLGCTVKDLTDPLDLPDFLPTEPRSLAPLSEELS